MRTYTIAGIISETVTIKVPGNALEIEAGQRASMMIVVDNAPPPAPDAALLAACKYWLHDGRFLVANCDEYNEAVEMARAAIAEAEARQ